MTDDCTCANCNTKRNRIAAFGAIRRAAEVARSYDAAAITVSHRSESEADVFVSMGDGVRRAIRAAIGSPKSGWGA